MVKKVLICVLAALVVSGFSVGTLSEVIGSKAQAQEIGHEPMIALLLGLIIPGGAQFYNGDIRQGITYLVAVVGLACLSSLVQFVFFETWHGYGWWGIVYIVSWAFWGVALIIWLYAMWKGYQRATDIAAGRARKGTGFRYDGFDLKPAYALR